MAEVEQDYTDARCKHLGMIQDVIDRMATASAWLKRLAIVVVGGVAAIAARSDGSHHSNLPLLAVILILIFWVMDSRYHQQERWFRDVFDSVRIEPADQRPDFRVGPTADVRAKRCIWPCLFGWSTAPFYLALTAFLALSWRVGP